MDLLKEFFDDEGYLKHVKVPIGAVCGSINKAAVSSDDEIDENIENGKEQNEEEEQKFIEEYRRAEEKLYATNIKAQQEKSLYDIETDTTLGTEEEEELKKVRQAVTREVFQKYTFNNNKLPNAGLPIVQYKTQIIDFLRSNSVLIIQGPTGCGKTTQVPQYILDNCRENNEYCNIVVTQPRRIAAISVARRVCEERGWAVGSVCGYQVGLERTKTSDTILTYVTTGVLLQSIVRAKSLQNYTHIIIDEVHERSQEMDFVLLLIRKFLYTNSFNIKIILMSATFDTCKFQEYFKNTSGEVHSFPPTLHLIEESKYNTQLYYINQLETLQRIPEFNPSEPKVDPILFEMLVMLIRIFDRLDKRASTPNQQIGSVLVFLPGIYEIEESYKHLTTATGLKNEAIQWYILPLHSSITNDEQRKVFNLPNPGFRKIILSTNIAESSITVPDITYVIDFCLTKSMVVNPVTKYESLQLQWASQVNCTQRAGRVGRVNDGRVYRFVSRSFYEEELQQDVVPEMVRAPLDRIVLSAKELNLVDPPKAILALAIDPPNLANIQSTIWNLKEAGGMALTCRGVSVPSDGDLTYLGHIMANLPLSIQLSKMVFLGHMFSCLNDCIIMAAGCSLSNIFSTPFQAKMSAYQNRLQWADGSCSDLLAYLNLYKVWYRKKESNLFTPRSEKAWAQNNYINMRSLREWHIMVRELRDRLERLGLREAVGERRVNIGHLENALFFKVCIAGALYPNYFRKPSSCGEGREQAAVRLLAGRDPYKTVYFTDMDKTQPGPLYARRVKELFDFCKGSINIQFDSSCRVYVNFNLPTMNELVTIDGQSMVSTMPGKICKEVYLAIKRRQLRMDNVIRCLPAPESWKVANNLGITENSLTYRQQKPSVSSESALPTMDMQFIKISVSLFIDCGHFWAHNVDEHTKEMLLKIAKQLNTHDLLRVAKDDLNTKDIYACQYDDGEYYRCKIVSNSYYAHKTSNEIQVCFIDYGDIRLVSWESLRCPPTDIRTVAPQAMECILCGIKPSIILNPRAMWSDRANEAFQKHIQDVEVFGKVYSVVNSIVYLELYKTMPGYRCNANSVSFNDWLIKKGFAQQSEESYLSKENHEKREKYQAYENSTTSSLIDEDNIIDCPDVEPPSERSCTRSFTLRGPFSPLETKIFSMLDHSQEKHIVIDSNSINSVLLDTDPQDKHDRLVAAVTVGENATRKNLNLRHTTIMPNIQGFPMIMALLFSPKMEPKPIQNGTRFGAILCGLGVNVLNKPLFPEHDLVITLDTELSQELLSEINELRYWMNMTVRTIECLSKDLAPSVDINVCQREIKHRLENILKKPKQTVDYESIKYSNIWRKFLYNGEIMEVGDKNLMENDIWPMHWTMCLKEVDQKTLAFNKNIEELKDYATGSKPLVEVTCTLCDVLLYTRSEVALHLITKGHADKAEAVVI